MEWVFFWIAFCLAVGMFADNRGRSGIGWFFFSLFLSPLLGFIFVAVNSNVKEQQVRVSVEREKREKTAKTLEKEKAVAREKAEEIAKSKICPQCAETVKAAAKICRFCRYEFGEEDEVPENGEEPEDNVSADSYAYKGLNIVHHYGGFVIQRADGTQVGEHKVFKSRSDAEVAIDYFKFKPDVGD